MRIHSQPQKFGIKVCCCCCCFSRYLFHNRSYFQHMIPDICFFFCSVLTPYYAEDVLFSINDLENLIEEDGVSILYYLQKIFPGSPPLFELLLLSLTIISVRKTYMLFHKIVISTDEWKNFLERVKCKNEEELREKEDLEEELRLWASYRGQTLTRTGISSLSLSWRCVLLPLFDNEYSLHASSPYSQQISSRHDVLPESFGTSGLFGYGKGWRWFWKVWLSTCNFIIYYMAHHLIFINVNCFYSDLMKGYKAAELESEKNPKSERSLWAQCQAIADLKFAYVVSCQQYGIDKRSGHSRAKDILKLMAKYFSQIQFFSYFCFSKRLLVIYPLFSFSQVPISSGSLHWWSWSTS